MDAINEVGDFLGDGIDELADYFFGDVGDFATDLVTKPGNLLSSIARQIDIGLDEHVCVCLPEADVPSSAMRSILRAAALKEPFAFAAVRFKSRSRTCDSPAPRVFPRVDGSAARWLAGLASCVAPSMTKKRMKEVSHMSICV